MVNAGHWQAQRRGEDAEASIARYLQIHDAQARSARAELERLRGLIEDASAGARYGTYAMELLINHLLTRGAKRANLEAKLFGGGNVLASLVQANVGHKNAAFAENYLRTEQIRIVARDLADVHPRKVYYFPATGRVLVKRLRLLHNDTLIQRETEYRSRIQQAPDSGDVELFTCYT